MSLAPASAVETPPGLQTFSPRSSQNTTLTFNNTTGEPVNNLTLSIKVPKRWKAVVLNSSESSKVFSDPIAPGETVSATFTVTSGKKAFNGDLVGKASWTNPANNKTMSEITSEKVRNVNQIKINEFRISSGSPDNTTNSFIEICNAGDKKIDISNWTLTYHQTQLPVFSSIKIPSGTKLAPRSFYLLGLSNSGLAVPASKGESVIYVRSTTGMEVGDIIEIGDGSAVEMRRIASIGTSAGPGLPQGQSQFGGGRQGEQGSPTTLWQPLPEGPVITIPKGSTNIPVTSVAGFRAGEKMAIGYGATYPTVAHAIEKYEVVTVTEVGKPGTQAWLSMDAKAGDRNIKVSSVANISAGDKIRLDINSPGHGIEWVTVTNVGTRSVRNTFNGPLRPDEDPGTGLDLAEPLKFDHASNMPFSAWGTGISIEPATAFDHSSNEPVLPLGTGITLDQPLSRDHEINAVVRDPKVTAAGYQGSPAPDQWFGGPALSTRAGTMVLRDAAGNVVDGLNYGLLVDPWAAEGYQAASGAGKSGCFVPVPVSNRGFRPGAGQSSQQPDLSAGRFPDGFDSDFNCRDFLVQSTTVMLASAEAGSNNIKVSAVSDFVNGQKITIGNGEKSETAVIAIIGTTGAATTANATTVGEIVIPVTSLEGFAEGQTITIDSGDDGERAVIASVNAVRRRGRVSAGTGPMDSITLTVPLTKAHAAGVQISGTGITLAEPLTLSHDSGSQVAGDTPTPGGPNQYNRKL
jgi:hypothetical protein